MRRMSNRTPPFALVGLVVICFILGYNYWTVSSQNGDLKKEIEKLQTQVKMGGLKQEQLENKNAALQGNVHNMASENNALSSRLKQQLTDDEEQIKNVQTELKQKVYEITSLKKDLLKQQEIERDLQQQLESKDMKLEENQKNVERILSLKNDADEALAERDSNIIELKTTVQRLNEQLKIASARKDDLVPEPPKPGAFNIPNNDKKDVDNNIDNNIPDFGKPIDEIKDPQNNVIQNPPIFKSEKDEPKPNLAPVEGVLKQPDLFNNSPIIGNYKNEHVLPPPLQNPEETYIMDRLGSFKLPFERDSIKKAKEEDLNLDEMRRKEHRFNFDREQTHFDDKVVNGEENVMDKGQAAVVNDDRNDDLGHQRNIYQNEDSNQNLVHEADNTNIKDEDPKYLVAKENKNAKIFNGNEEKILDEKRGLMEVDKREVVDGNRAVIPYIDHIKDEPANNFNLNRNIDLKERFNAVKLPDDEWLRKPFDHKDEDRAARIEVDDNRVPVPYIDHRVPVPYIDRIKEDPMNEYNSNRNIDPKERSEVEQRSNDEWLRKRFYRRENENIPDLRKIEDLGML